MPRRLAARSRSRASERAPNGLAIVDRLLSTLDQAAAGALYLCHLALEAASVMTLSTSGCLSYALEQATEALPHFSFSTRPPSLIHHAEEAPRWVAVAIDQAYRDPPTAPRAIADALGHLLVVCVFADLAYDRHGA